jgi:hypothetical protein
MVAATQKLQVCAGDVGNAYLYTSTEKYPNNALFGNFSAFYLE